MLTALTKNKKLRRLTASTLALAIFLSAFMTFWSKAALADPTPVDSDTVTKLWDAGHFNQGGKVVEVLKAGNDSGPYVYCVKASANLPVEHGGTVTRETVQNSSAAQKIMGKVKAIIEMPDSTITGCTDWQADWGWKANGTEGYIVRQLLIWNEIYKMESELTSAGLYGSSGVFRGYDLNSLSSTNYPLVRVAKEIASSFDEPASYIPSGPTYKTIIQNKSSVQYDSSKGVYYATFTVTVQENHTGSTGGTFHFNRINGGNVYLSGSSTACTTASSFSVTSSSPSVSFRIEGTYSQMISDSGKKKFLVTAEATSGNGNSTTSRIEFGLFRDSTDPNNQTFVAPFIETRPMLEATGSEFEVTTGNYELTKVIRHPDGSTTPENGIRFRLYNASYTDFYAAQSAGVGWETTTNASGKATWTNIPVGDYKLVQVDVPSNTYAMNPNPATVTVSGGTQYGTYYNDEIVGYLQINKRVQSTADATAGTTFANLPAEEGAVFQVWNTNYTSFDAAPAYMRDTLTTDATGKSNVSKGLPVGTYKIHQTAAGANALMDSQDTTVTITASHTASAPNVSNLTNKAYEQNIQIRKVDEETGTVIPAANVEFEIYKSDKTTIVPSTSGETTFKTDDNGEANITDLNLTVGTYYIKEKTAPKGYILTNEMQQFTVNKGDSLITVNGNALKRIDFADKAVTVELELTKSGQQLAGSKEVDSGYKDLKGHEFVYADIALKGAQYELYVETDVLDVNGDYRKVNGVELKAGTLIGTYTTDANGKITVPGLYLDTTSCKATYKFVEVKAPNGFTIDNTPIVFDLSDDRTDMTVSVIKSDDVVTDKKQSAELTFEKVGVSYQYDATAKAFVAVEKPLGEAVFGVYTTTDVLAADGTVALAADQLIEVIKSDDSGKVVTTADYPLGYDYVIRELEAPEGYMKSETDYIISAKAEDGNNTSKSYTFKLDEPIKNELSRACLAINKIANDTKLPMSNVEFEVIDPKTGDVIEKIVTDKEGKATTKTAIPYDATIILRETKTDEKYELMADEEIRINVPQKDLNKYGVQDVTVYNFLKAEIAVVKVTGDGTETIMDGVEFELWKKGTNGEADTLVFTDTTDDKGELHFYVPTGEYYLKETSVGKWTKFDIMSDPIDVSASEHEKVYNFKLSDDYTTTLVWKHDAKDGKPIGNCGISVRNSANIVLTFVWNETLGGYVCCDANTEGATQVLFTNNDKESAAYGSVKLLGLENGKYEVFEVQAPDGYRNDSEVLGVSIENRGTVEVLHLYDTLKTAERDTVIGFCLCGFFGVTGLTFLALALVMLINRKKRQHN